MKLLKKEWYDKMSKYQLGFWFFGFFWGGFQPPVIPLLRIFFSELILLKGAQIRGLTEMERSFHIF